MNTKLYKLLMLVPLLLVTELSHAAVNLGINQQAQSGNSIEIGIFISGLGAGASPSLKTYDLDVSFDASHLSFANAVFGDSVLGNQLDLFNFGENAAFAELIRPDALNVFELSFDAPTDLKSLQADSFTLATLTFDVLNAGTSSMNILINALGDVDGNALLADTVSAEITTVPATAAVWLMVSGLGLLFRMRK